VRRAAVVAAALVFVPTASAQPVVPGGPPSAVRILEFAYRAHDGLSRLAWLVVPRSYDPAHDPPIPLVISPHGRGAGGLSNALRWGDLPARGGFAVVNPEGQGRRLALYSWGAPGQIEDLARMPGLVERAFPWVRVDRRRIYAIGASMGGQETLLLVARHPRLLAGAAAFDAPTDMALRYRDFLRLRRGLELRRLARFEIGGPPRADPEGYEARSPSDLARAIAASGVPLELWWSVRDRIVVDEAAQSGRLYREIERLDPDAPVREVVGRWAHTAELDAKLPVALRWLGLLPVRNHRNPVRGVV
jgi:pimeloyl-ACP methyl ester carboxylesterase